MTTAVATPIDKMSFVGIDPSLTATGFAMLRPDGSVALKTIETSAIGKTRFHRIKIIVHCVMECMAEASGAFVCIEAPFMNPKMLASVRALMELNFAIRDALYWNQIPFREIPPANLKKFVANQGAAKKELILKRVFQLWNIDTDDNNEADACGLAYMAKAIHSVRNGVDCSGWYQYQVDEVKRLLEKG